MSRIFLAYYRWCKKNGPEHLTISAWAWKHQSWLVTPIDAVAGWFGQVDHCKQQFERETAPNSAPAVVRSHA